MNVYDYFRLIRKNDYKVKNAKAEFQRLMDLAQSVNAVDYSADRVQNGKTNQEPAFVHVIDQIDDKQRALAELISKYNQFRDLVFSQVESLEPVQARVLYLRYFEFKSLEKISVEMHYSYYGTRSIYRGAIRAFKAKFGEEYEWPAS